MWWLQHYKCMWETMSEKASVKAKHEILWKDKSESEWNMKSCNNITTKSVNSVHLKGVDDLNSKGSIDPTTMVPLHRKDLTI